MRRNLADKAATEKPLTTKVINKIIESLMIKSGIKSGPEFTAGS